MSNIKRQCAELPGEVISHILSKLENARYIAVASTVSKSWYRSSLCITTLKFSTDLGQPEDWFRMVRARLSVLENIHLQLGDKRTELCLGVVTACYKLTNLSLLFKSSGFDWSFLEVFRILSVCTSLRSITTSSTDVVLVLVEDLEEWEFVKLPTLKELTLKGFIIEEISDFLSAFPALEELEYDSYCPDVRIESLTTLRKLKIICPRSIPIYVKAPELISLICISPGAQVSCELAATVERFEVHGAKEVNFDATHITSLALIGSQLRSLKFPKLVSVQNLDFQHNDKRGFTLLKNLRGALDSAETLSLTITASLLPGVEVRNFFNNLEKLKSLHLTLNNIQKSSATCRRPASGHLPELKRVQYVLIGCCEWFPLQFIVKSAPALASLQLSLNYSALQSTDETKLLTWLFEMQRSKPELTIHVV